MSSQTQIQKEVEDFYQGYIDAFNAQDTERYAQCFSIPYAFVRGGGLAICYNDAELKMLCEQTLKGLKSRGWERSETKQLSVWPLEEDHAMILADVSRYKHDNTVLEQGRFCYTARFDGRHWKMLTIFPVAEPFTGPGQHKR